MANDSNPVSIGTVAEGVAVAVAVGFVISVIYDWGFLYALDLNFAYLPTTTADHFRSGLIWFPPLLYFIFVYIAIEFQFQRVERGLTESEIIGSSRNPDRMRKFREGPRKLVVWMAPLYVLSWILIGDAFASMLPWVLAILWMVFADWCYSSPLIRLRRSKGVQLGFTILPTVGILAFFSGYNAAVDAAVRKPVEVTIERTTSLGPVSGKVLRVLDKGFLLLGDNNSIRFIPWEQVQALQTKKTYRQFRGVLCEWFKRCQQSGGASNEPVS